MAACTIGTASTLPNESMNGDTFTFLPVSNNTKECAPTQYVSACVSSSVCTGPFSPSIIDTRRTLVHTGATVRISEPYHFPPG